jgi:hypothetical protein
MPLQASRVLRQFRYAFFFDGVDDYVDCGSNKSLNLWDQVTVEFWMREERCIPGTWNNVIGKASGPFDTWDNGSYVVRLLNYNMTSGMFFTDGTQSYLYYLLTWGGRCSNFVVVFWSYNYHALYYNGELVQMRNVSKQMRTNNYHVWIGGFRFRNSIALVRIYSRALSQSEIQHNMNNPENPVRNGLVLWLYARPDNIKDIDNDGVLEWIDLSGYGNHGKIYGPQLVNLIKDASRTLQAQRVLPYAR